MISFAFMQESNGKQQYIISGIGTDVGKTVVSAIFAEALHAIYWKPVQSGDLEVSDSIKIGRLTDNAKVCEEKFRLSQPMSPHAAATIDGVSIRLEDFVLPDVSEALIVEGAGGLMVPINNDGLTYLDVFEQWKLPVILVSKHYLGSINHTLLSIAALKSKNIPIEGIVFVGEENEATESIILKIGEVKMITRIPWTDQVSKEFILAQAEKLRKQL